MIDSYWELYVAYVNKCVRENWINDIDPHHYEMEWNHFLPRCVFGDWAIGHYLTLRQHAIASALQTLALEQQCMCGWHIKYLPPTLLELAWPYVCKTAAETLNKSHLEKDEKGRSVFAVKGAEACHNEKSPEGKSLQGIKNADRLNREKNEEGKSVNAVKAGKSSTSQKGKDGKSINAVKASKFAHSSKDEQGRSLLGIENSKRMHKEKNEEGKSISGVRGARRVNSQKWQCLVTGHVSTPGPLTVYQVKRGIDPSLRLKLK
jgi:hypothetical protein